MTASVLVPSPAPLVKLDEQVIARLRAALVADRAAQEALVVVHQSTSNALTGQRDVDSILEREIADASAARAREAMAAIDDALVGMAAGSYGGCESCRTMIPLERLQAVPHARYCVACANQHVGISRPSTASPTRVGLSPRPGPEVGVHRKQALPSHRSSERRSPPLRPLLPRQRVDAPFSVPRECCGFEAPAQARVATALRSLAGAWGPRVATADARTHERASQLRDELHAVANRVGRLLETPGAALAPISVQATTTAAGPGPVSMRALIQPAAERLAELVDELSPEQWELEGRIARSTITIAELVAQPLHTSHHYLHGSHLETNGRS